MASKPIKMAFNILGYDENTGRTAASQIGLMILLIAFCMDSFLYVVLQIKNDDNKENLLKILLAIKDISAQLSLLACSIEYMVSYRKFGELLFIIDKKFTIYEGKCSPKIHALITQRKTEQKRLVTIAGGILFLNCVFAALLPGVLTIYIIFKKWGKFEVVNLPLPIAFYYPEGYDTFKNYVLLYTLQVVYLINLMTHSYCIVASTIGSIHTVVTDIELFCININEIDSVVNYENENIRYMEMKNYLNFLIDLHQQSLRNVKSISRGVSVVISAGSESICVHICIFLYCAAEILLCECLNLHKKASNKNKVLVLKQQVDTVVTKIGNCVLALTLALTLLIYCYYGQKVVNAGENLRKALYDCSWMDKPKWFKRDLQLMMTIANVPLIVKPLGLYVLDLANFSVIMNAAYSYFNLLISTKK